MAVVSIKNKLRRGNLLVGNEAYDPGAFYPIATTTVGSGGSSSVTFSNIPSTYTHLQVRGFYNLTSAVTNFTYFRLNNDTTSTNYATHIFYGNGTGASTFAATSSSGRDYHLFQVANGAQQPIPFILNILDYANTNKYKVSRLLYGSDDNTGGRQEVGLMSGLYMSTSAVSRLDFVIGGGNIAQYSHFALYGIKSA